MSDGHTGQELVQLLVVADGQLQVSRDDAGLLVVASSVAGQLEDLSAQVLEHGGQVDGCAGADALGIVALAQQAMHATDRELKARFARARLGLCLCLASFASSRHY